METGEEKTERKKRSGLLSGLSAAALWPVGGGSSVPGPAVFGLGEAAAGSEAGAGRQRMS